MIGRRRIGAVAVEIGPYDLLRARPGARRKSLDQRPQQIEPRRVRQALARYVLVKAPFKIALAVLLHDQADVGRLQVGAELEMAMHARLAGQSPRCISRSESSTDRYRGNRIPYSVDFMTRERRIASRAIPHWLSIAPSFIAVAPAHEGAQLAVRNAALEHPEPAVWMHIGHPAGSEDFLRALDGARDGIRGLDLSRFDVDDAKPEADLRPQVAEGLELVRRPVRGFHHDMIDRERIE